MQVQRINAALDGPKLQWERDCTKSLLQATKVLLLKDGVGSASKDHKARVAKGHKELLQSMNLLCKELIDCRELFCKVAAESVAEDDKQTLGEAAGYVLSKHCHSEFACNDLVEDEDTSASETGKSKCCATPVLEQSELNNFSQTCIINLNSCMKCINNLLSSTSLRPVHV